MQETHIKAKLRKSKLSDSHRMDIFELTGNSNVWDDDWEPTEDDVRWLERKAFQLIETLDKVKKMHYNENCRASSLPNVELDKSKPRYIPVSNMFCDSLLYVREDDVPKLHATYCRNFEPSHWICEMMDVECSDGDENYKVKFPSSDDDSLDMDEFDEEESRVRGFKTQCLNGEVDSSPNDQPEADYSGATYHNPSTGEAVSIREVKKNFDVMLSNFDPFIPDRVTQFQVDDIEDIVKLDSIVTKLLDRAKEDHEEWRRGVAKQSKNCTCHKG